MSTYPRSSLRVLRILMCWSSGHVSLLREECVPPKLSPQSDLGRRADSRWALPQISTFFSLRNLRGPSADRREILHDTRSCVQFYNPGPKFWGASQKILGAKNMQNLARFRSTSKFSGECPRNGWRYSKSASYSVDSDSARVKRNKSGEVWSSNLEDLDVELYPPKAHFSENHILDPSGCCVPKFLHALENDQVLVAHTPPGTGTHLTIFFQRGVKNGP